MRKEDFFVFIYNPTEQTLWQTTHKQIYKDLKAKADKNKTAGIITLEAFEMVHNGEEPDDVLRRISLEHPVGESPEALLKAYKWIWGAGGCQLSHR